MNFEFFTGNLTDDPILRSKEGAPTARTTFTLAVSDGKDAKGKEKVHFPNFTAFGSFAENLLSLKKGTRMNIQARVDSYVKEVQIDGKDVNLTMITYIAMDGGPSMKWASVKVVRNEFTPVVTAETKPAVENTRDEVKTSGEDRLSERSRRNVDEDSDEETPRRSSRPERTRRPERDDNDEPRERTRRVRPTIES